MIGGQPRRPEVVAQREQEKLQILRFTCDGCGQEVMRVKMRVWKGAPHTSKLFLEQARDKHKAETGCSGEAKTNDAG